MLCQGPSERLESSSVSVWAAVRNRLRRGPVARSAAGIRKSSVLKPEGKNIARKNGAPLCCYKLGEPNNFRLLKLKTEQKL